MTRDEAINALLREAEAIKSLGAMSLYIFGSISSNHSSESSDLDLFIDYDQNSQFNAFDLIGIKLHLEDRLEMRVDLTTRDGLHPRLKREIEKDCVRVF